MTDKTLLYVRVSAFDQNPQRQLEFIKADKTFIDYASGKDTKRPSLNLLMDYIREGDLLVVHSMDRLARNLDDLRNLVTTFTTKGARVRFFKENLTFTGEDNPFSVLLLSVMGAVYEFERSLLKERQREGIALAKKKGAYKGRKPVLSPEKILEIHQQLKKGEKKSTLAKTYGISRQTLYRYLETLP